LGNATSGETQFNADNDYFQFPAEAGHVYRVTAQSSSSASVSLALLDPAGTVLSSTYNSYTITLTSELGSTAEYFVRVRGYYSSSLFTYTVKVEDLGLEDHGDAPAEATELVVGNPAVDGKLEHSADVDYFRFTVTGGSYAFQAISTGMGTTVSMRNAAGGTLTSCSGPSTCAFSVPGTGDYFLRVTALNSGAMGSYSLRISN